MNATTLPEVGLGKIPTLSLDFDEKVQNSDHSIYHYVSIAALSIFVTFYADR